MRGRRDFPPASETNPACTDDQRIQCRVLCWLQEIIPHVGRTPPTHHRPTQSSSSPNPTMPGTHPQRLPSPFFGNAHWEMECSVGSFSLPLPFGRCQAAVKFKRQDPMKVRTLLSTRRKLTFSPAPVLSRAFSRGNFREIVTLLEVSAVPPPQVCLGLLKSRRQCPQKVRCSQERARQMTFFTAFVLFGLFCAFSDCISVASRLYLGHICLNLGRMFLLLIEHAWVMCCRWMCVLRQTWQALCSAVFLPDPPPPQSMQVAKLAKHVTVRLM